MSGDNKLTKEEADLIYLVNCAMNSISPLVSRIRQMDLEAVYELSTKHFLGAMVYIALENTELSSAQLMKKWKEYKNKVIRKNMLLDAERQKIIRFMNENKIKHMPLKGIILKEMYPQIGMRQMSDNDILFDSLYQKEIQNYMVSNGYEAVAVGKSNHDIYRKQPVYNFEMHTSLFAKEEWASYYQNIWDRLISVDEYEFSFSKEDFYVYILLHAYKHFEASGTGLRSLLDIFVILQKFNSDFDWNYIECECDKLGISDFEMRNRLLIKKVFVKPEQFAEQSLERDELDLLKYYLTSGTYGTKERRIHNRIEKIAQTEGRSAKYVYIFKRVFMPIEDIKMHYPFIYKHIFLLPFFWIWRIIRGTIFRSKNIIEELCYIFRYKEKN